MNNKYFILIRIFVWLIALAIFFMLAFNYFSFDGQFNLKYSVGENSGYVSRFYSPSNYEFIEDEDKYFKIKKTPTAFNLKVPLKFHSGKLKITFRTDNLDEFEFGVIEDEGKSNFRLYKIRNENKGQWNTQILEIDLKDVYYHPEDKLGFVFMFKNGEVDVKDIEFELFRDNLWQTLSKKLKTANDSE